MDTSSSDHSSKTSIKERMELIKMMIQLSDRASPFPFVLCRHGDCPYLEGIVCYNPEAYTKKRKKMLVVRRSKPCQWI
jgi:hypothetical protein